VRNRPAGVNDRVAFSLTSFMPSISKRGNRYLRVLFVQAAWVVLIKPKSWDRHGLSRGSRRPRSGCITTSSPSRSPTSSLALFEVFWLMVERSTRASCGSRDHSTRVVETSYLPRSARDENEMEDRSSRRMRTLVTKWPIDAYWDWDALPIFIILESGDRNGRTFADARRPAQKR
jgi:hypothetical protein